MKKAINILLMLVFFLLGLRLADSVRNVAPFLVGGQKQENINIPAPMQGVDGNVQNPQDPSQLPVVNQDMGVTPAQDGNVAVIEGGVQPNNMNATVPNNQVVTNGVPVDTMGQPAQQQGVVTTQVATTGVNVAPVQDLNSNNATAVQSVNTPNTSISDTEQKSPEVVSAAPATSKKPAAAKPTAAKAKGKR